MEVEIFMTSEAATMEESAAVEAGLLRRVGLAGLGMAVWIGENGESLAKRLANRSQKIAKGPGRVFNRLVEKGERAQPRGRERMKAAASRLEEASAATRRRLRVPFDYVGNRLKAGKSWSEEAIDSKVSAALKKRGFPTRKEVQVLVDRIDVLSERLDRLQSRGKARKSAAASEQA